MTPATRLLVGYLVATGIVLLAAVGGGGRSVLLVGAHWALLLAVVASRRRGGAAWGAFRDWAPLLAVPLLYAELPLLMEGIARMRVGTAGVVYHDPLVLEWERGVFGNPSGEWAARMAGWWLSEPLHLAYLLYYPLIYVPPLLLYRRGRREAFDQTVTALVATFLVCFAIFAVFPVQGPRYLWPPSGVHEGPVRGLVLSLLDGGSSRGSAFPSSHVAVAAAQVAMAFRWRSPWAWLYAMVALGLSAGAVYGGFHYAVDAVAGALLGLLVAGATMLASSAAVDSGRSRPASSSRPGTGVSDAHTS